VAISSGHKIGKSYVAAMLALWFYCTHGDDARVICTSTTSRQVDEILWRAVQMLKSRSGKCVDCKSEDARTGRQSATPCPHSAAIDGDMGGLARTGLKAGFRQIVGFTAKQPEAVAGMSGPNMLYIADEASGIPEIIFQAIEGNRAGGASIAMFSNPTRNEGSFFDAFHDKKDLYKTITVSSEDTPNCQQNIDDLIPGLANPSYIAEKEREWGRESALFKVRVLGVHALHEDGRIFSVHAIQQAMAAWKDLRADRKYKPEGRLYIGLDPAGASGKGDETVFAPRRGLDVLSLHAHLGLDAEQHLVHLLALMGRLREPREIPVVVMDREGAIGAELYGKLRAHLNEHPNAFLLSGIRASDGAVRQPEVYDRMRDGLVANLEAFMREGLAVPEDDKLAVEMHQFEWKQMMGTGKLKATDKITIRKALGRSPDRYDAVALSCWEPISARDEGLPPPAPTSSADYASATIDPYAASPWGRR
jgi:phage terminase large subunit